MRSIVLFLFLLASSALAAVEGLNTDGSLDRSKISKAYFEGDFDKVVNALETWRKMQPNPTREDRIYAYKYLSVIYAAKPETRSKAESFMYQLLKLMPSIELMDLYISDNIEAIFNSVRLRFEHMTKTSLDSGQGNRPQSPALGAAESGARGSGPAPDGAGKNPSPVAKNGASVKSGSTWPFWTAGAVGLAALAVGYLVLSEPQRTASASPDTLDLQ
jgi:hypothetical protein